MGNREGEKGRGELMQKQEGDQKRKRGREGGPGAEQWKQEKRGVGYLGTVGRKGGKHRRRELELYLVFESKQYFIL